MNRYQLERLEEIFDAEKPTETDIYSLMHLYKYVISLTEDQIDQSIDLDEIRAKFEIQINKLIIIKIAPLKQIQNRLNQLKQTSTSINIAQIQITILARLLYLVIEDETNLNIKDFISRLKSKNNQSIGILPTQTSKELKMEFFKTWQQLRDLKDYII